ncbi:MmyB family transcriptional regulator [Rhizobium leguminosarum]|uniref:MmyB family transcriptional regulator n=1 Tax=Rhizobium leguminosarum TaxID=384 RepID=UPI0015FA7C73
MPSARPFASAKRSCWRRGYAPMHLQEEPGHVSFEIDRALQRILRQHEPFPAIVMGRYWNFVASNNVASRPSPRNLLHLALDPDGLRPFLEGFDETARSLLQRVRREAVGGVLDEPSRTLLSELTAYRPESQPLAAGRNDGLPVIPRSRSVCTQPSIRSRNAP